MYSSSSYIVYTVMREVRGRRYIYLLTYFTYSVEGPTL